MISVENLGVRFWLERRDVTLIRDILFHPFRRRTRGQEFWALRGVSFHLERGRILGVIGRNGAGKSTLLMALAGIYAPDEGRLKVRGRVTSLLEVGAGFRLELTGRENVYLYAAILGITRRQVHALFDRIVDFSGLEDFIDAPMRTYSTGMQMRLGFAVAVSVEPDVLLVDEALSVGDTAFQTRAMEYIETFRRNGGTIVYVSHDMARMGNLCDRCLLLEDGRTVLFGQPLDVIATYWERTWGTASAQTCEKDLAGLPEGAQSARRWGSGEIRITGFTLLDHWGRPTRVVERGTHVTVEIRYTGGSGTEDFLFQVILYRDKQTVAVMKSDPLASPRRAHRGEGRVLLRFDTAPLAPAEYSVDAEIRNEEFTRMYDHLEKFTTLTVVRGQDSASRCDWVHLPCQWTFIEGGGES